MVGRIGEAVGWEEVGGGGGGGREESHLLLLLLAALLSYLAPTSGPRPTTY